MYCNFEIITPNDAAAMLQKNPNYRRINDKRVLSYALKMEQGFWQENGEPIQFDKSGNLLNGQHRLKAIIKSGKAQKMLVVRDVEANVFDVGKTRTWSDYTRATNDGKPIEAGIGGAIGIVINAGNFHISNPEARYSYFQKHKYDLDKAFILSRRGSQHPVIKKAGFIAAIYCAIRLEVMDDQKLEAFCQIVNSGFPSEAYASETAIVLRKQFTEMQYKVTGSSIYQIQFETLWQALEGFKRGLKTKKAYKPNGCMKDVIKQVKDLDAKEEKQ